MVTEPMIQSWGIFLKEENDLAFRLIDDLDARIERMIAMKP